MEHTLQLPQRLKNTGTQEENATLPRRKVSREVRLDRLVRRFESRSSDSHDYASDSLKKNVLLNNSLEKFTKNGQYAEVVTQTSSCPELTKTNTLPRRKSSGEARLNRLVRRLSSPSKETTFSFEVTDKNTKSYPDNAEEDDDYYEDDEDEGDENDNEDDFPDDDGIESCELPANLKTGSSCPVLNVVDTAISLQDISDCYLNNETDNPAAGEDSDFMNIQYFSPKTERSDSMHSHEKSDWCLLESDDEIDSKIDETPKIKSSTSMFEEEQQTKFNDIQKVILDSEANYLECLSITRKFMKAIEVNLTTSNPVISKEDFHTIFFKIEELYEFHKELNESRNNQPCRWEGDQHIGYHFKQLSSQTNLYIEFLNNYANAVETFHKCTNLYPQFSDLACAIKMQTLKGNQKGHCLSLQDLLYKPVSKCQKSSLKNLLNYTPEDHPDYEDLTKALQTFSNFLNDFNPDLSSKSKQTEKFKERELIRDSLIVELCNGSRKLRHLFLFDDVLVCGKHKTTGKKEDFSFQLKWFIPLDEVRIKRTPKI